MNGPFARTAIVLFDQREYRRAAADAIEHAQNGGQALHVWDPRTQPGRIHKAPQVFRQHFPWAHLIDHDRERLVGTARRLGVRRIVVGRDGGRGQHVDLCAEPLYRAIATAAVHAGYEDVIFEKSYEEFQRYLVGVVTFRFAKPTIAQ